MNTDQGAIILRTGLQGVQTNAGNKPNLSYQVGTVVSSEAGEPLGIRQGTEKLEEMFGTKKWVVASITGIPVTVPRGYVMEWEPTVDSTIVHGFIEPESVNGTDYESGDSSVDETENGPSARSLLATEGTENETLEVLGAVRRVKEKRKSSPKLDEEKADSKPTEFQLVETSEKESRISLEQSKEVSEKDSAFTAPPLELSTVLLALQESDQLAQQRRPLAASSAQWEQHKRESLYGTLEVNKGVQSHSQVDTLALEGKPRGDNKDKENLWHIEDGLLCRDNKWYVPSGILREALLRQNHDDPNTGHFGVRRRVELIQRKHYWSKMRRDIKSYVETCTRCHQVKAPRHKPYGELVSLPIPQGPRQNWTMDFIADLPPSIRRGQVYDSILVTIDRYTKFSRYIPARKDWEAETMSDVLVEEIFTKFGMPVSIVTDWRSLFTSKFWSHFCYHLRVRLNYSTAFYPQTDGQTERQNQTLVQYLRCYVNYQQDDWLYWLPIADFAYNNSLHSVINMTPIEVMFGEAPKWEDSILEARDSETPVARLRAVNMLKQREKLRKLLNEAVNSQAKFYNEKRMPKRYKVGEKVLLSAKTSSLLGYPRNWIINIMDHMR